MRDDFGDLHTLERGDTITWTTKLGVRTYEVTSVQKVKETDTSGTAPSNENKLTLYTCVRNQRDLPLAGAGGGGCVTCFVLRAHFLHRAPPLL